MHWRWVNFGSREHPTRRRSCSFAAPLSSAERLHAVLCRDSSNTTGFFAECSNFERPSCERQNVVTQAERFNNFFTFTFNYIFFVFCIVLWAFFLDRIGFSLYYVSSVFRPLVVATCLSALTWCHSSPLLSDTPLNPFDDIQSSCCPNPKCCSSLTAKDSSAKDSYINSKGGSYTFCIGSFGRTQLMWNLWLASAKLKFKSVCSMISHSFHPFSRWAVDFLWLFFWF